MTGNLHGVKLFSVDPYLSVMEDVLGECSRENLGAARKHIVGPLCMEMLTPVPYSGPRYAAHSFCYTSDFQTFGETIYFKPQI